MTRTDHLLVILMEECAEVTQRASKILRFGLSEIQADQNLTNSDRLSLEIADLLAAVDMLAEAGAITRPTEAMMNSRRATKKVQVERYLSYSNSLGRYEMEEDEFD